MLHYWMEGCFANSNTRFRKFFRLTRARFDEIYEAAAVSGLFVLNRTDTHTEIVESERLFRALGLPGVLTCMEAVHMAYDKTPYPSRHLFMTRAVYRVLPASFRGHSCACCRSLRRAVAVAGAHCSDLPLPGERLEALRRAISS